MGENANINGIKGSVYYKNQGMKGKDLYNDILKIHIKAIKENTLNLPDKNFIEFLDKNPTSGFAKLCGKYCNVKYLKNGIRDPREFVDTGKIGNFVNEVSNFAQSALKSGNVENYAKKALKAKTFNIAANVCISSLLLAGALPKVTFMLRKLVTGKEPEPGLV